MTDEAMKKKMEELEKSITRLTEENAALGARISELTIAVQLLAGRLKEKI